MCNALEISRKSVRDQALKRSVTVFSEHTGKMQSTRARHTGKQTHTQTCLWGMLLSLPMNLTKMSRSRLIHTPLL